MMNTQIALLRTSFILALVAGTTARASQDTIGPNGINSAGLTTFSGQPLTGSGEDIGQVEETRPGRPGADNAANSNPTVMPKAVYLHNVFADPPLNMNVDPHAERVAGIMISTDPLRTGVAGGLDPLFTANLYSSAFVGDVDSETQAAQSAQFIATRDLGFVSAINFSFTVELGSNVLDGNSLLTQFVDWSAAHHDVLYVTAGRGFGTTAGFSEPTDNFNGITVASADKDSSGVYSVISPETNDYSENSYSIFNRTFVSLMAPGEGVQVTGINGANTTQNGTSYAAPHVTATVALLQQYGQERISAGDPKFPNEFRRHEVMKAVLLNSADKIKDDNTRTVNGIRVPKGGFLEMDRTVLDKTGNPTGTDWLRSDAYQDNTSDGLIPLDAHMGAGELDAKRANST
jgi:Subtilase family